MLNRLLKKLGWHLGDSTAVPASPMLTVSPALPASPFDYINRSWEERKKVLLAKSDDWFAGGFTKANVDAVEFAADGKRGYVHVIFNLGADALGNFLHSGKYLNAYQKPVVGGKLRGASKNRRKVDEMLALADPEQVYFCAISGAGTGVRYYGEYCVALKSPDDAKFVKRVLDRNSYDFISEPFKTLLRPLPTSQKRDLIQNMMCDFRSDDFKSMLSIKVLQHNAARPRLLTPGQIAEGILVDEDYVEALHEGSVEREAILEVRSHPDDRLTELGIEQAWHQGKNLTPEELLWMGRRQAVSSRLESRDIPHKSVSDQGRSNRWK
jgi:hypothetical protein